MLRGGVYEKFSNPGKVFLLEMNITEGIIGMGIESG